MRYLLNYLQITNDIYIGHGSEEMGINLNWNFFEIENEDLENENEVKNSIELIMDSEMEEENDGGDGDLCGEFSTPIRRKNGRMPQNDMSNDVKEEISISPNTKEKEIVMIHDQKSSSKLPNETNSFPSSPFEESLTNYDQTAQEGGKESYEERSNLQINPHHLIEKRKWDVCYTFHQFDSILTQFVCLREWDQFHTTSNLILALVGELGELCEIFQFVQSKFCQRGLLTNYFPIYHKNDERNCSIDGCQDDKEDEDQETKKSLLKPNQNEKIDFEWTLEKKELISQEISDVFIYLLRFCSINHLDLGLICQELVYTTKRTTTKTNDERQEQQEIKEFQYPIWV